MQLPDCITELLKQTTHISFKTYKPYKHSHTFELFKKVYRHSQMCVETLKNWWDPHETH